MREELAGVHKALMALLNGSAKDEQQLAEQHEKAMRRALVQFNAERSESRAQLDQANRRLAELELQLAEGGASSPRVGPPRDPITGVREVHGNLSWGVAPSNHKAKPARDDWVPHEFCEKKKMPGAFRA